MVNVKVSKAEVKRLMDGLPKKGFAEILVTDPKKTGSVTVRDYMYQTDQGETHRPYVNMHGEPVVLKITKKIVLNLAMENDRLSYGQILHHPLYLSGSTPLLKIKNVEDEAEASVLRKDLEAEINGIIRELKSQDLQGFARVLLIPVRAGSSDNVLKQAIYEKAEANPAEVLAAWKDEDRPVKALVRLGIERKKISEVGGVYMFQEHKLGLSFEQAVEWMNQNEDLQPQIRKVILG